jgi:hypothetical protein
MCWFCPTHGKAIRLVLPVSGMNGNQADASFVLANTSKVL